MAQLSAAKERFLKNAVILSAQAAVFKALTQHYGLGDNLKQQCTKIGSGSTPKGGKEIYVTHGIPFVRSLNVRHYEFQEEELARVSPEIHSTMSGTCVFPNDVFLNITGASIGRSCCVPSAICPANVSQHVAILRPIPQVLDSQFLMYWLNDSSTQEDINAIQKGATRQALTKVQIESFRLPKVPLDEQKRVAEFLNAVRLKQDFHNISLPAHLRHIPSMIARIEELAVKVEEARGLRSQTIKAEESLIRTSIKEALSYFSINGHLGDILTGKPRNGWSARCDNAEGGTPVLSLGAVTGFTYRSTEFKKTSEVRAHLTVGGVEMEG